MESIGRYEIKKEIGRGGMATVYLGLDTRFQRQVAIKVLPRQFTHDPKFLARFEMEAITIAALEHPNIVPVYDFGEYQDAPYLVMRHMSGGSLVDKMGGRPLPIAEISRIFDALAPALDKAHHKGIIHRDLKPGNILFDDENRPFLSDFGIARMAEATHTMTIIGTPAYMSPEQVRGKITLDGRSDLYAFGVILFELLSGRRPYEADTPSGEMFMHVMDPIPDVRSLNPALPPGAQTVINKAMAKNRRDRYSSAVELAAAVRSLVSGESEEINVRPPPAAEPAEQAPVTETVVDSDPEPALPLDLGSAQPAPAALRKRPFPSWLWWVGGLILLALIAWGLGQVFMSDPADLSGEGVGQTATPAEQVVIEEQRTVAPSPTSTPQPERATEEPPPPEAPQPRESFLALAYAGEFAGTAVELLSPYQDENEELFREAVRPFEEATGIEVIHIGSPQFESDLDARVNAGDAPDMALFTSPSSLAEYAAAGQILNVAQYIEIDQLSERYTHTWLESGTFPGPEGEPILAGVWHLATPKDLVWYPTAGFESGGYQVPESWEDLLRLSEQMAAEGRTPWCIAMESGAATGWVATDWVEAILLRLAPPEVYDAWVAGDLPFNSPEVKTAVEFMSQIWFNPDFVLGGREQIVEESFMDSPVHMFENPPQCLLHKQASFVNVFFPGDLQPFEDYDLFYLPPIDAGLGRPMVVAGQMLALFTDQPQAIALMEYLSSGASKELFMREGIAYAPQLDADPNWYSRDLAIKIHSFMRDADTVRFDASDAMPPQVGAGAFWEAMTEYVRGSIDLDQAMQQIDDSWPR